MFANNTDVRHFLSIIGACFHNISEELDHVSHILTHPEEYVCDIVDLTEEEERREQHNEEESFTSPNLEEEERGEAEEELASGEDASE